MRCERTEIMGQNLSQPRTETALYFAGNTPYKSAFMSSIVLVAWWGAILSTVVFLWDIYKFKAAGPKLRFSVRTGMQTINMPAYDGKRLITTEVTNYRERPTTLTNIGLYYFDQPWSMARFRNHATKTAVLRNPNPRQPFPWELKPGEVWRGGIEQIPELEEWATKGRLYFDLYHSHSTRRIRRRVVIRRVPGEYPE
jgi:hypothetical protein